MNRRTFLGAAGATVLAGTRLAPSVRAAEQGTKPQLRTRFAVPPDIFRGMPFDKALEQIAAMGFPAFERLGWEGLDLEAVRKKADELGLEYSCIVGAGRIAPGGLVNPEDHDKVIEQFKKAVEAAHKLNVKRLVALTGNERNDVSRDQQKQYIIEGLKKLAPIAEAEKVTLVLEPLNVLVDHRGYFLSRSDEAAEILKAVNSPNVKMLFDIYHQQITEGNLIRNIKRNIDLIGHFHVADNPGRHEPGTGEINYRNVFKAIYETGYRELVALEFSPSRGATAEQVLQAVIDADQW